MAFEIAMNAVMMKIGILILFIYLFDRTQCNEIGSVQVDMSMRTLLKDLDKSMFKSHF